MIEDQKESDDQMLQVHRLEQFGNSQHFTLWETGYGDVASKQVELLGCIQCSDRL